MSATVIRTRHDAAARALRCALRLSRCFSLRYCLLLFDYADVADVAAAPLLPRH